MNRIANERGVSLVLAIMTGLFLSILGYATISAVITDARSNASYLQSMRAFWLAESGAEVTRRWLRFQDPPPEGTDQFIHLDHVAAGLGTYTVTIDPDDGNASTYLKSYKILAVGDVGGVQRKIEIELKSTTFNYYAYMTGDEGGTIWFHGGDVIEGPTHSNDQISITQDPVFMGKLTSSASSFNEGSPFNPDFREGYQLDVPAIAFPTQQDIINNYWASNSEPPGLTIDATYGKHSSIVFNSDGTLTYNVWHYNWWGWRIYDILNETVSIASLNGMVWVDGDVRVEGTVDGDVSVVSTDDMYITDDVVYADSDADGKPNPNSDDLLGLISFKNIIVKDNFENRNDVVINAALLTLGNSFTVENYNWGSPRGHLTIWGSLSQKVRGPVGTFSWGGWTSTGYDKDYHYDTRLAERPPPYFPVTGQYHFVYWKELTE